jgi:hypothetical protein
MTATISCTCGSMYQIRSSSFIGKFHEIQCPCCNVYLPEGASNEILTIMKSNANLERISKIAKETAHSFEVKLDF